MKKPKHKQTRNRGAGTGKLISIRLPQELFKKLEKRNVYIQDVVRKFLTTIADN